MRPDHTTAATYVIRVQGRLDRRWASRFAGCTLAPGTDGTTDITGTVVDQAALHGLLQVLRDLGLPLLSVLPVEPEPPPEADHARPHASPATPSSPDAVSTARHLRSRT